MANNNHAFLDPLWRRVLLVAACAVWAVIETVYGERFWATLVGGMAIYSAWSYLYAYKPSGKAPEDQPPAA